MKKAPLGVAAFLTLALLTPLSVSAQEDTTPPVVITTIDLGAEVSDLAITPDGATAWVTGTDLNSVLVIDLSSNSLVATIPLPGSAGAGLEIDITPDGETALVTNYVNNSMSVIDITSETIVATVPVGGSAADLHILTDSRTALARTSPGLNPGCTNPPTGCMSVIEAPDAQSWASAAIAGEVQGLFNGGNFAITPDDTTMLEVQPNFTGVDVIVAPTAADWPLAQVVHTIDVGARTLAVALTPDGRTALVAMDTEDSVGVLEASDVNQWDTATHTHTIGEVDSVVDIAISSDGRRAWVIGANLLRLLIAPSAAAWSQGALADEQVSIPDAKRVEITPDGTTAVITQGNAKSVTLVRLIIIDSDGDGVDDAFDNCPDIANPTQDDADANGVGDECNESEDSDDDEFADNLDNCPADPNPGQEDEDADLIGDICDPFPNDRDNEQAQCEIDLNECSAELNQCLADNNADDDGDGEINDNDRCPGTAEGADVDDSGCSQEQFCNAVDATSSSGRRVCRKSDWKNDEPTSSFPRDCEHDRNGTFSPADDTCTPS